MEFIWECMILSFKTGVGTVLWGICIIITLIIITSIFGVIMGGEKDE